jgi:hypothetical protein
LLQLATVDLTLRRYDTDGLRTDAHRGATRHELELGGYLSGRRLYETMLTWETDPSMRDHELRAAFADVWCAISNVAFSRTLDATEMDVSIDGAGLARQRSGSASSWSCAAAKRIDIGEEGNLVSLSCAALGNTRWALSQVANASGHSGVRQFAQMRL